MSPSTAAPRATSPSTIPTRSSTASNRPVWSGAAVRRSPWRSSYARCGACGDLDGTGSSSPTVKRANRLRSRTGGCCATARISSSTACDWPPALVGAPHAHVYVSDLASGTRRRDRAGRCRNGDPRRPDGQCPHSRTRLRGRRGDRRGARHQRRPGQTHRQAAAALRTGRGRAADPDQQRRDAGQPALHPPARRGGPTAQRERRRQREPSWRPSPAAVVPRASTRFLSGCRSPNCLRCTGFRRRRCAVC